MTPRATCGCHFWLDRGPKGDRWGESKTRDSGRGGFRDSLESLLHFIHQPKAQGVATKYTEHIYQRVWLTLIRAIFRN